MEAQIILQTRLLDEAESQTFTYDFEINGKRFVEEACANHGIENYEDYCARFINMRGQEVVIQEDETLPIQGVIPESIIYLIKKTDNTLIPQNEIIAHPADTVNGLQTFMGPQSITDQINNLSVDLPAEMPKENTDFEFSAIGGEALLGANKDLSSKESDKIINLTIAEGFNSSSQTTVTFNVNSTYEDIFNVVTATLGIDNQGSYKIMLRLSEEYVKWFEPDHYLEDYNPIDGMQLYIFPTNYTVSISSAHLSIDKYTFQVDKTVRTIVKEISTEYEIPNSSVFTIYAPKGTDNRMCPLELDFSIPEQVSSLGNIQFRRRYFLFSREDFMSETRYKASFIDARSEIRRGHCIVTEDKAIELAAYCIVASNQTENPFSIDTIFDDMSDYLPKGCEYGPGLGKKVKDFLSNRGIPDMINAIRLYIRACRTTPGFGVEVFDSKIVEDEKTAYDVKLQIGPLRAVVINNETQAIKQSILYQKIIEVNILRPFLNITYMKSIKDIETISVNVFENVEIASSLISEYRNLIIDTKAERAKLIAEGRWDGPTGKEEKVILITAASRSSLDTKAYTYLKNVSGYDLLRKVRDNLKISEIHDDDLLMLKDLNNKYHWISMDQPITKLSVFDGSTVYLIRKMTKVSVSMTSGESRIIEIDLTKTVSQLVEEFFSFFDLPYIFGHTLFILNEKNTWKALDPSMTIPQQTPKYDQLLFKRRFYILSKEDISSRELAKAAFYDCRDFLVNSYLSLPEDKAIELAILSIYATLEDPHMVSSIQSFQWETMFPKSFEKFSTSFQRKFSQLLEKSKRIDSYTAIKSYLKNVRDISMFGAEVFRVNFKNITNSSKASVTINDGRLFICPLNMQLMDNSKNFITKINWRNLIGTSYRSQAVTITFVPSARELPIKYEFTTSKAKDIAFLISGSLKNYHGLLKERHMQEARQAEEIRKRLAGRYIDEKGVKHGPQMNFALSSSTEKTTGLKQAWIDLMFDSKAIIDLATPVLKLSSEIEYVILLREVKFINKWLLSNSSIDTIQPSRGSTLFCLPRYPEITISSIYGVKKSIVLDITQPISILLPQICSEFKLPIHQGLTLFTPPVDNLPMKSLDIAKTIPEQAQNYQNLILKRRFFAIQKCDFDTPEKINQLYYDTKDMILSGCAEIPEDTLIRMTFISLKIDPIESTSDSNNDSISSNLPTGVKQQRNRSKTIIKMLSGSSLSDLHQAKLEYINLAEKLNGFGSEKYSILLGEKKVQSTLKVSPNGIELTSEDEKLNISNLPFDKVHRISHIGNDISIEFSNKSDKIWYINGTCDQCSQIVSLIKTYQTIINDQIMTSSSKNQTKLTFNLESMNSGVKSSLSVSPCIIGRTFLDMVHEKLGISQKNPIVALLKHSRIHAKWVEHDDTLISLNPYDGILVQVYNRYLSLNIIKDQKKEKVFIDVSQPLKDIIPILCDRFFIFDQSGYTLFTKNKDSNTEEPLCFTKSIPEQADLDNIFIFRRRFFALTESDIEDPLISEQLYPDFMKQILSGFIEMKEPQMLELAVYSLFANADNPNYIHSIGTIADASSFLPSGMPNHPAYCSKLIDLCRGAPLLTKQQAMANYLATSRKLNGFGAEMYSGSFEKKIKTFSQNLDLRVLIGPFGVQVQCQRPNGTHFEIGRFGYKSIIHTQYTSNRVLICYLHDSGASYSIRLNTKDGKAICDLISDYRNVVYPIIRQREQIQREDVDESLLDSENSIEINSSIILAADRFMRIKLNTKDSIIHTMKIFAHKFSIPMNEKFCLLYKSKDFTFQWIGGEKTLYTVGAKNNDFLYMLSYLKSIIVTTLSGISYSVESNLSLSCGELCNNVCQYLEIPSSDGYSLYFYRDRDLLASDLTLPIVNQFGYITESVFKRRFFLFSKDMIQNEVIINNVFNECKILFQNGIIQTNNDAAIALALFSIMADLKNQERFEDVANESYIVKRIPSHIKVDEKLKQQLSTRAKQVPIMEPFSAKKKFISICCQLTGFGREIHDISYRDCSGIDNEISINACLALNPYKCSFFERNGKLITSFEYNQIISFTKGNQHNELVFKFISEDHKYCHFYIQSEFISQIFSFIEYMVFALRSEKYVMSIKDTVILLSGSKTAQDKANQYGYLELDNSSPLINTKEQIPNDIFLFGSLKSICECSIIIYQTILVIDQIRVSDELRNDKQFRLQLKNMKFSLLYHQKFISDGISKIVLGNKSILLRESCHYHSMYARELLLSNISKIEKIAENGKPLTNLFKKLVELYSLYCTSLYQTFSVNLYPASIRKFIESVSPVIIRISSFSVSKGLGEFTKSFNMFKETVDSIEKDAKKLEINPLDEALLISLQNHIIKIHRLNPQIRSLIRFIDSTDLHVLFDRYVLDLENSATDTIPTGRFNQINHLLMFHNFLTHFITLINGLCGFMQNRIIQKNTELVNRLVIIKEFIVKVYYMYLHARKDLSISPYDQVSLNASSKVMKQLSKYSTLLNEVYSEINEISPNREFNELISEIAKETMLIQEKIRSVDIIKHVLIPDEKTQVEPALRLINMATDEFRGQGTESILRKAIFEISSSNKVFSSFNIILNRTIEIIKQSETEKCQVLAKVLTQISQPPVVSIGYYRNRLSSLIKPTNDLLEGIQTFRKRIRDSAQANEDLQSWSSSLQESLDMIRNHLSCPDFVYSYCIIEVEMIEKLLEKVESIPPSIHKLLTPLNSDVIGRPLGDMTELCGYLIKTSNSLPRVFSGKLEISNFPLLSVQAKQLSISIDQIHLQYLHLNSFMKEIMITPSFLKLDGVQFYSSKIANVLQPILIGLEESKDQEDFDISSLYLEFKNVSDVLSDKTDISVITQIDSLPKILSNLCQNTDTIISTFDSPKSSIELGKAFTNSIRPIIERNIEVLSRIHSRSMNVEEKKNIFISASKIILEKYVSASLRRKEELSDKAFIACSDFLLLSFDNTEFKKTIRETIDVYEAFSHITTLPTNNLWYSEFLQIHNPVISVANAKLVSKMYIDYLYSFHEGGDLFDYLMENLNQISNSESYPNYLRESAQFSRESLVQNDIQSYTLGVIAILLSRSEYNMKINALEQFVSIIYRKLAGIMNNIGHSIDLYLQQFKSSLNQTTVNRLINSKKAISKSDPLLLVQCSSLSTIVLLDSIVHEVSEHLSLLLHSLRTKEQVNNSLISIIDDSRQFFTLQYVSDEILSSLFYVHVESLTYGIEKVIRNDFDKVIPLTFMQFVKNSLILLKKESRAKFINWKGMMRLSNLYLDLVKLDFNMVAPESNLKGDVITIMKSLSYIRPLIVNWTNINVSNYHRFISMNCILSIEFPDINRSSSYSYAMKACLSKGVPALTNSSFITATITQSPNCSEEEYRKLISICEENIIDLIIDEPANSPNSSLIQVDYSNKDIQEAANEAQQFLNDMLIDSIPDSASNESKKSDKRIPKKFQVIEASVVQSQYSIDCIRSFNSLLIKGLSTLVLPSFYSTIQNSLLLRSNSFMKSSNDDKRKVIIGANDLIESFETLSNQVSVFESPNEFLDITKRLSYEQVQLIQIILPHLCERTKYYAYDCFASVFSASQIDTFSKCKQLIFQSNNNFVSVNNQVFQEIISTRLIILLFSLLLSIIGNVQGLFKQQVYGEFVRSLSSEEILSNQQVLLQMFEYCHSPEILNVLQSQLSVQQAVIQIRILTNAINCLIQRSFDTEDIKKDTSPLSLLQTVFLKQQLLYSTIDIPSITSINDTKFIYDVMVHIFNFASITSTLVSLLSIKISLINSNHHLLPSSYVSNEQVSTIIRSLQDYVSGLSTTLSDKPEDILFVANNLINLLSTPSNIIAFKGIDLINPTIETLKITPTQIPFVIPKNSSSNNLSKIIEFELLLKGIQTSIDYSYRAVTLGSRIGSISENSDSAEDRQRIHCLINDLMQLSENDFQDSLSATDSVDFAPLYQLSQSYVFNSMSSDVFGKLLASVNQYRYFELLCLVAPSSSYDFVPNSDYFTLLNQYKAIELLEMRLFIQPNLLELPKPEIDVETHIWESNTQSVREQLNLISNISSLQRVINTIDRTDLILQQFIINAIAHTGSLSPETSDFGSMEMYSLQQLNYEKHRLNDLIITQGLKSKISSLKESEIHDERSLSHKERFRALKQLRRIMFEEESTIDEISQSLLQELCFIIDSQKCSILETKISPADIKLTSGFTISSLITRKQANSLSTEAASAFLKLMPSISLIPIEECKGILISKAKTFLITLKSLLHWTSYEFPILTKDLIETSPQLIAAAVRVLPELGEDKILPNTVFPLLRTLILSAISLENPEQSLLYYRTVLSLLEIISSINATVALSELDSIVILGNIAQSIIEKNIASLAEYLIELNSFIIQSPNKMPSIGELEKRFDELRPQLYEIYASQSIIGQDIYNSLSSMLPSIISIVNTHFRGPFDHLISIKSVNEAVSQISQPQNNDIIYDFTYNQAVIAKAILISECHQIEVYMDFYTLFSMALSHIAEALETSQTGNRRLIRSLNRIKSSFGEMIGDICNNNLAEKPTTMLSIKRLEIMKIMTSIFGFVSSVIASRRSTKLDMVFQHQCEKSFSPYSQSVINFENEIQSIIQINKNPTIGSRFEGAYNNLRNTISSIKQVFSEASLIPTFLSNLIMNLSEFIPLLNLLTDIAPMNCDMESAEKLPLSFVLPTRQMGSSSEGIDKIYISFETSSYAFIELIGVLSQIRSNNEMCEKVISLNSLLLSVLECSLSLSSLSINVTERIQMLNYISKASISFDLLIKVVRNKFLLRGSWQHESPSIIATLKETITAMMASAKICKESVEIAAQSTDEFMQQWYNTIKILQNTSSSLEFKRHQILEAEEAISRQPVLKSLLALSHLSGYVEQGLLADFPSTSDLIQSIISLVNEIDQFIEWSSEAISGTILDPESIIIERLTKIATITYQIAQMYSGAEEKKKLIWDCYQEIYNLIPMIQAVLNKKIEIREYKERITATLNRVTESARSRSRTRSREESMELLKIESSVIRSRAVLKKAEEKLKSF